MKLSELKTGESGVIVKVSGHGGFRKRVIEMGFIKGKKVDVLLNAVATGINAATTNEADRNDDTYTLDGRKVNNPTAPGLYIKGGKKVIK